MRAGQTVKEAFPEIDTGNAVIVVNGRLEESGYVLKENDVVMVRCTPSGVTAAFIAITAAIAVGAAITGGIQAYKAKVQAEKAQKELERMKRLTNKSDIDNRPFLRGASNTVATGNSQPYIIGRHFFTPYLLCSPFYKLSGEDGKDQYTYIALECGFNRQILQKISIDDIDIKTFNSTEPQEGAYGIDAGIFAEDGLLEVAQDGELLTEIPELNYKVKSVSCNDEIAKDSEVSDGSKEYLTYTLDPYAKDVDIAITFAHGLYATDDSGNDIATQVAITPEYSLDGGKSWRSFAFQHEEKGPSIAAGSYSSRDADDRFRSLIGKNQTRTLQRNLTIEAAGARYTIPKGTSATYIWSDGGNDRSVRFGSILTVPFRWVSESSSSSSGYGSAYGNRWNSRSIVWNTMGVRLETEAVFTESIGANVFKRNTKKELSFAAHKDFSAADYNAVKASGAGAVYVRVRSDGASGDSMIHNDCYVLFYQSVCFDPDKSTGSELVPCRTVEDRERKFCTILALRLKATKSNEDKLKKINIITQGTARTWNGTEWSAEKSATRNPAAWVLEIETSPAHPASRYDDSELDLESFGDYYDYCEENGFRFDWVVTQNQKKDDILGHILEATGACLYYDIYGRRAVAIDRAQENALAVYNPQNIISIQNKKSFGRRTDGLRVKYVSCKDDLYQEETYLVMREGQTLGQDSIIKDITATGITEHEHIVKYARRLMAIEALRPKTTTIEVGNEGIFYTPYSKVLIQDDSLKVGIGKGFVVKSCVWRNGTLKKIRVNGTLGFEEGKSYGIIVNCFPESNARTVALKVAGTGETDEIDILTEIRDSAEAKPEAGNVFSFGELADGEFSYVTSEYIISGIKRSDKGFRLELVNYNEAVYSAGPIPEYKSGILKKKTQIQGKIPEGYATQQDVQDAVKRLYSSEGTQREPPDSILNLYAEAQMDRILIKADVSGDGTRNTLSGIHLQVRKTEDGEWLETTVSGTQDAYIFNRQAEGYPEAEELEQWLLRAKAVNIYGQESDEWVYAAVDTFGYGTWKVQKPELSARVSGRNITISMEQPERSDGKELYGAARHIVLVKRAEESEWHTPDPSSDPYKSEESYKSSGAEGISAGGIYQQVMPLSGQSSTVRLTTTKVATTRTVIDNDGNEQTETTTETTTRQWQEGDEEGTAESEGAGGSTVVTTTTVSTESASRPVDTAYNFRIAAYNAVSGYRCEDCADITVIALATSARDIVDSAITTNKLAEGAVTMDKLHANCITAEKMAARDLAVLNLTLGKVSGNKIVSGASNYWDLESGEFRIGNDIELENVDTGEPVSPNASYLHFKSFGGVRGLAISISKFIVTSAASVIKGIFKVQDDDTTSDFMIVNPTDSHDSLTNTGARTVSVGGTVNATAINAAAISATNINATNINATRRMKIPVSAPGNREAGCIWLE